jgi:hypothetical protein
VDLPGGGINHGRLDRGDLVLAENGEGRLKLDGQRLSSGDWSPSEYGLRTSRSVAMRGTLLRSR